MTMEQIVTDAARTLVQQIAPQELPLFQSTSAAFFRQPKRAMRGHLGKDEMLGFGAGGVTFLTPTILIAARKVFEFVAKSPDEQPPSRLSSMLGGLIKKNTAVEAATRPVLTSEHAAQARALAAATLREHGFPEDQVDVAAETLVKQLTTDT
jgi:hypothetical protein